MRRTTALAYGSLCYAVFFASFLYLVGFLGNLGVPKSIDSGEPAPLGVALLVDTVLLLLFGVQHSVMARPGFKAWWTRFVPGPVERSTYVLATVVALVAIYAFWQPMPQSVWHVSDPLGRALLTALFLGGVALVLVSTFLIDHFDLFGLRQVWLYFRGRPYAHKAFRTPLFYKWIRHPLYVGWIAAFWVTPSMSAGHFLFALVMTSYILIAIPMEESDLLRHLGEPYRRWRERTPLFVPRVGTAESRPVRTAESH
jgi:protein-S-isoprenylcysteine O-methyltransferase Ste14